MSAMFLVSYVIIHDLPDLHASTTRLTSSRQVLEVAHIKERSKMM